MHPYREHPVAPTQQQAKDEPAEESFLAVLLIVLGGLRLLAGILTGAANDAGSTLALLALAIGISWRARQSFAR